MAKKARKYGQMSWHLVEPSKSPFVTVLVRIHAILG